MSEPLKNLIKVPEITPELLEKNAAQQMRWRKFYQLPVLSVDKYAEQVISANLQTLDALHLQMKRANNQTKQILKQKSVRIRKDTAVWLASLGNFQAAFELAVSKQSRRLYREYIQAEQKPNDLWCEHPVLEYIGGNPSQVAFREFDFFSQKMGRKVSMVCCRKCNFRNAKDLNIELQRISEHRANVTSAAKDVSRENIAQKLNAENLLKTNLAEIL